MNFRYDGCKEWFKDDKLTVFSNPEGLGFSLLCKDCSSNIGATHGN